MEQLHATIRGWMNETKDFGDLQPAKMPARIPPFPVSQAREMLVIGDMYPDIREMAKNSCLGFASPEFTPLGIVVKSLRGEHTLTKLIRGQHRVLIDVLIEAGYQVETDGYGMTTIRW